MARWLPIWLSGTAVGVPAVPVFPLLLCGAVIVVSPSVRGDELENPPREPVADEVRVEVIRKPGDDVQHLVAKGVIAAPPQRVWEIIDNCAEYKKNLVSVADSEELSREGNTRRCSVTVAMPFPFPNLRAVSESTNDVEEGKIWKRTWRHIEGDFKSNTGSWTLVPYGANGEQTMLTYEFQAEPSIPVPQFIVLKMQKWTVPALFEKIRSITQDDKR